MSSSAPAPCCTPEGCPSCSRELARLRDENALLRLRLEALEEARSVTTENTARLIIDSETDNEAAFWSRSRGSSVSVPQGGAMVIPTSPGGSNSGLPPPHTHSSSHSSSTPGSGGGGGGPSQSPKLLATHGSTVSLTDLCLDVQLEGGPVAQALSRVLSDEP